MCDLEATGAPSIFRFLRNAAALARMFPTFDQLVQEFYFINCLFEEGKK